MNAESVFAAWLATRKGASRDAMSDKSSKPYRYVWLAWCRWLANTPEAIHWQSATQAHIEQFLIQGTKPASKRKKPESSISPITRFRYGRILHSVYEFALNEELISANPGCKLMEENPISIQCTGQIFDPNQWSAIYSALPERQCHNDIRDRIILLLMLDNALTVAEIIDLRLSQVILGNGLTTPCEVNVSGPRAAQSRKIQLEMPTSIDMRNWLVLREQLRPSWSGDTDRVFLSQIGQPMKPFSLFHLVASIVGRALSTHSLEIPNHVGPQALRNTRIVIWLNSELSSTDVMYRAGFKHMTSFRRLSPYINDKSKLTLTQNSSM